MPYPRVFAQIVSVIDEQQIGFLQRWIIAVGNSVREK